MNFQFLNLSIIDNDNQGMVDPGETVTNTIKTEFSEALNTLIKTDQERKELYQKIDNLLINGKIVPLIRLKNLLY